MPTVVLATLAVLGSGCSLIGVHAPDGPRTVPLADCTESSTLPIIDTVPAVIFGGVGVAVTAGVGVGCLLAGGSAVTIAGQVATS
jgi:hypothetical protein